MADDHSDLAEAMDNLGTAISNVAASTPSGAPHAMVWVEKAKMAINAWRQKFMPQAEEQPPEEPVAEPEEPADPPVDEGSDAPSDPPAWSPPAG